MEIKSVDCPKCGGSIPEKIIQGKLFKCNNCGSTLVWPDNQSRLLLSFGIRICPNCGVDNDQNCNFCKSCGTKLTKSCPSCKSIFYVGDNFCPNGHNYDHENQKLAIQNWKKAESILEKANYAYYWTADKERVLSIIKEALSLVPDLAEAYFLQGNVLDDLDKQDDAIIAYRNALKYDPTLSDAKDAIQEIETGRKKKRKF